MLAGALVAALLGDRRTRIASGALYLVVWGAAFGLRGIEWTERL